MFPEWNVPAPQQEREGKSRIGAYRKRESTKAMAGNNARKQTARGTDQHSRSRKADGHTRGELYAKAKNRRIEGRSRTSRRQLENALGPADRIRKRQPGPPRTSVILLG